MLSGPLRDRFQLREHLGFYSVEELTTLVLRNARKLSVGVDGDAAEEIARRSRSTPRVANNRLRWVRDYATSRSDGHVSLPVAQAALEMAGIDGAGLDTPGPPLPGHADSRVRRRAGRRGGHRPHHEYGRPTRWRTRSSRFCCARSSCVRTPRGRTATSKAYQHLQFAGREKPLF